MTAVRFFKMLIAFSYGVVKNQHFQSTLLGRREKVTTKEYSVYTFGNVYNYGRPLTRLTNEVKRRQSSKHLRDKCCRIHTSISHRLKLD